jgi:hypothetical protein
MNADPGKRFQYDSIDTYLLSAIVQKVTGMNVLDYLRQRVFKSLNITDVYWELSPEGIVTGGWGLYIQPESLAKFGQLLLQRGRWRGEQLIPAEWVDAMMREHVSRKDGDGYCYQMWRCGYPTASRADGAYGQYVVVVPRQDAVIVINQCNLAGGGRQFGYIWKTLFKGMHAQPLPPSDDYQLLLQRADSLPVLTGETSHQLMADYQGAEGFSRFIQNMMLTDYVDADGRPKDIFMFVWSMMKDLDATTYFNAVDEYCSFMESFVRTRGERIVQRLKNILNIN